MAIIKDGTSGTGLYSNAWKMADNMIIASSNINIKEGQLLSLNLVLSAVKLAQHHLEQIPQDYKDPSASAYHIDTSGSMEEADGDLDNDPAALQAHIAKKQRAAHIAAENKRAWWRHEQLTFERRSEQQCTHTGRTLRMERRWTLRRPWRRTQRLSGQYLWHGIPVHPGNQPEVECWHHDLTAEQANIDALEKKLAAASAKAKDREALRQHEKAQYVANKTDDLYTVSFARWDPSQDIPSEAYSTICLNVTQNREYLKGAAVDSASPIDIQNEEELAQLTCSPNVFLEGIIP
eukprot:250836-Rhodomonas_salina.2